MAKRPITIQLEPDLIAAIDRERGKGSRQQWIADACDERLDRKLADAMEEKLGWHLPGPNVENVRSSAQIKRDIQERPKGGK